jgi:phage terminase large subunit-like protein
MTRASAAGTLYRGGRVYYRAGTPWLADFEHELLAFPAAEHDDQVDTGAYAAADLPNLGRHAVCLPRSGRGTLTGRLFDRADVIA